MKQILREDNELQGHKLGGFTILITTYLSFPLKSSETEQ